MVGPVVDVVRGPSVVVVVVGLGGRCVRVVGMVCLRVVVVLVVVVRGSFVVSLWSLLLVVVVA